MALNLEIGAVYTFNTRAAGILQATVKNARLESKLGYKTAVKFENIDLKFRQIYPNLPAGTPDTPTACVYYLFETESGEPLVLADQWIDEGTVDMVDSINFTVTFTKSSFADMNRIRDILNAATYTNYEIKQI